MHQAWQIGRTFPKKIAHLNAFGQRLIPMDTNFNSPEYKDIPYRTRRLAIGEISKEFQIGDQIPQANYTQIEHETWRTALKKLNFYQRNVMSRIYLNNMKQLQKNLDFSLAIPKMNDLSNYLKSKTGFQIKPVAGMIDQREFLNCLAFRVFCSGQFIRHHQCIEFTTEPDIIHEYVGHIPMLVNPQIAEISHTIGLLSLGAAEEDIRRLGKAYLALIQLGMCIQNGQRKAYGAGIAACTADLIKLSENRYSWKEFQPEIDCQDKEQNYQIPFESFYVSKTIQAATESLLKIGKGIKKPFRCQYNANQKDISVLDIL